MQIFDILIILAILAVTITLGFGLYSLFRGGDYARSHSNKLMRPVSYTHLTLPTSDLV